MISIYLRHKIQIPELLLMLLLFLKTICAWLLNTKRALDVRQVD